VSPRRMCIVPYVKGHMSPCSTLSASHQSSRSQTEMYQCRSEAISACIFPSDNGLLSRGFAPMPGAGTLRARFGSLPRERRKGHGEAE